MCVYECFISVFRSRFRLFYFANSSRKKSMFGLFFGEWYKVCIQCVCVCICVSSSVKFAVYSFPEGSFGKQERRGKWGSSEQEEEDADLWAACGWRGRRGQLWRPQISRNTSDLFTRRKHRIKKEAVRYMHANKEHERQTDRKWLKAALEAASGPRWGQTWTDRSLVCDDHRL